MISAEFSPEYGVLDINRHSTLIGAVVFGAAPEASDLGEGPYKVSWCPNGPNLTRYPQDIDAVSAILASAGVAPTRELVLSLLPY